MPMSLASKADLLGMSHAIEQSALETNEPCVILSTFQTAARFTPATARLYAQLAVRSAFVGAFGEGMAAEPAAGVRGARLPENHSLRGEWVVILVAPHYARALIARDLGDRRPDLHRRFRYAVVTDRDLVLRAGRALMLKMSSFTNIRDPANLGASRSPGGPTGR